VTLERVFVYASLLSQREMDRQCRTARFVELAWIEGRRVAFTKPSIKWGGHAADVVLAPGDRVWGAVYEVDAIDLRAIDDREGIDYRRIAIELRGADGAPRAAAWVYEAHDHRRRPEAAPSSRYLATILDGARERALPVEYLTELERRIAGLPIAGG